MKEGEIKTSEIVLQKSAKITDMKTLRKIIKNHQRSIVLNTRSIEFSKLTIRIFEAEIKERKKK